MSAITPPEGSATETRQPSEWRPHLWERGVENGSPVLRCRRPDCERVWWPDQDLRQQGECRG